MTKKHIKAIAQIITNNTDDKHPSRVIKMALIDDLNVYFNFVNINFDASKFYHACFGKVKK